MKRSNLLAALVLAATILSPPLYGEDDRSSSQSSSVWVTSIAPQGSSGEFVAATADGLLLREASVVTFSAANPAQLTPLYSHPAAVWCVDATSDGDRVASVDYRGNLIVFDTQSAQATTHEKAFERWCQSMMISPDDQSIVAGNEAGKVMVWNIEAAKLSASAELDGHAITGLALSPDGSQLAASDGAGHVHLLKWPGLEAIAEIKISDDAAWCVAFAQDGSLLVGSGDRHLYRCEPKADAKPEVVAKGTDWITQIAISSAGQVAAAEVGGKLHFPNSGGADSMDAKSGVWALCWNGDQQLFAGTRKDGIAIAGQSWKWTEPAPPKAADPKDVAANAEEAAQDSEKKEMSADEKKAAEEKAKAEQVAAEKDKAEKAQQQKAKEAAEAKAAEAKKKTEEKNKAEQKAAEAQKAEDAKKTTDAKKESVEAKSDNEKAAESDKEPSGKKDE
jgi:hypothetical protein